MAKATTAKAPKRVKKAAKAVKTVAKTAPKGTKAPIKSKAKDAADALWKLAEHPLVGELLAAGAMAAVSAIAEEGLTKKGKKGKKHISSRLVKDAGKAAAAAIGLRLMTEFDEVKKAAQPSKPAKRPKPAKTAKS